MDVLSYRPDPAEFAWTFGGVPPVRRVRPGSILELWTEDAFGGRVRGPDDLVSRVVEFPFVNPQTGPFYVEGAEPGDTLAIHFVSIEPSRDWAASSTIPLFGSLTGTHATALLQEPLDEVVWMYEVDRARRTVTFRARRGDLAVQLPLDPMHGTVGVAPASFEARSSLVPDAHGGNMDTPEMRAGVTCYLGVNVEGALFSIGDGHATQGDGEVSGTAIETPMQALVRLTVRKDLHVTGPEFEAAPDPHAVLRNGPRYACDGIGPDLLAAARDALRRMIQWLGREHGLDPMQAYLLSSVAVDLRISEIVDVPNFVVTAYCPLGIFE